MRPPLAPSLNGQCMQCVCVSYIVRYGREQSGLWTEDIHLPLSTAGWLSTRNEYRIADLCIIADFVCNKVFTLSEEETVCNDPVLRCLNCIHGPICHKALSFSSGDH